MVIRPFILVGMIDCVIIVVDSHCTCCDDFYWEILRREVEEPFVSLMCGAYDVFQWRYCVGSVNVGYKRVKEQKNSFQIARNRTTTWSSRKIILESEKQSTTSPGTSWEDQKTSIEKFDFPSLYLIIMVSRNTIASILLITILCVSQSSALTTLAGGWKSRDHKKPRDHNKSSSLEFKVLRMKVQMFCAMYPKSFLCNPQLNIWIIRYFTEFCLCWLEIFHVNLILRMNFNYDTT